MALSKQASYSRLAVTAAVASLAVGVVVAVGFYRRRGGKPRRLAVTVTGDTETVTALRRAFETDKQLNALRDTFDCDLAVAKGGQSPAGGSHGFQVLVDGHMLSEVRADLSCRRRPTLPAFVLRWLTFVNGVMKRSGKDAAASTPQDAALSPPQPPSGGSSCERLESGAVAGARPEHRRRRTVEERICRVALDVLAPHGGRAGAHRRATALTMNDLPFDAFAADLVCADLVMPEALVRSFAADAPASLPDHAECGSEFASALLYLLDVFQAREEPLLPARTAALEAAGRIMALNGGNFATAQDAVSQVVGGGEIRFTTVEGLAEVLVANHLAVASHASAATYRGGPLAGGPAAQPAPALLPTDDTSIALLSLPQCSLGGVYLLRSVFDAMATHFGRWTMDRFIAMMMVVWERGGVGKEHPTGWSRLFRSMNRSRSGEISFEEFVCHFSRKVSACGTMDPDLALVLCLARQRFLHLLFYSKHGDWTGRRFWFDTLVEMHDGDM